MIDSPKKNKKKNYWTIETERYIRLYIIEKDSIKKNAIYEQYIHKPISRLIENIVHTYKLYNFQHTGIEDIKQECIFHILLNIHKFNVDSDTKSYSYIGTAVKNYLLQKQMKETEIYNNSIPIDWDLNYLLGGDGDGDKQNNRRKDNNVLNSIDHSYRIDNTNEIEYMFNKFIEYLKKEIEILGTMTDKKMNDWKVFLESFVFLVETNKGGIACIENKILFYNSIKLLNKFSEIKNYKFMNMLKEKYFLFKKEYFNANVRL